MTEKLTIHMPRSRRPFTATSVVPKEEISGDLMRLVCGLLRTGIRDLSYQRFEPEQLDFVGYVTYEPPYLLVRDCEEEEATDILSQVAMLWDELPILFKDPQELKIDDSGYLVRKTKMLRKSTLLKWYEALRILSNQKKIPDWDSVVGGRFPAYVCVGEREFYLDLPPLMEILNREEKIKAEIWPREHATDHAESNEEGETGANKVSMDSETASRDIADVGLDEDSINDLIHEKSRRLPIKRQVKVVRIIGSEKLLIADDGKRYRLPDREIHEHAKTRLIIESAVSATNLKLVDLHGKKHCFESELEFPKITHEDDE